MHQPSLFLFKIKKVNKMNAEMLNFKENVDEWIKEIRRDVSHFKDVSGIVSENIENTEHNYELIKELRMEIEELKHELNAMKIIQIASIRAQMKEEEISNESKL